MQSIHHLIACCVFLWFGGMLD